jgi:hypothetical protein
MAACRATVAICAGSSWRSAIRPSTVRRKPPPTQITAKPTCTALKVEYQFDDAQKTIATTRNAAPIRAVGRSDERPSGVVAALVSIVRA